ncbi:MAG: hypothetical protein U0869_04625 [Chloroflexota bacterium]
MTAPALDESGTTRPDHDSWWSDPQRLVDLARAGRLARGTVPQRIDRYVAARRRGTDWLLAQLRPDGALGDPANGFEYYRAPWTFGLVGEVQAAHAVCGFIRRNLLTPDGRIDGPLRKIQTDWSYRDATLIIGAQQIGEYDLSIGLFPELLRWQDPVSGAFANDREPDGSMSDTMDIPYACGAGFAALAVGRVDVALQVAGFLERIWDIQGSLDALDPATGLPIRFRCFWSRQRQRPYEPTDPGFGPHMIVDNTADRLQRWTIGGISAGFLCRLALAIGESRWVDLAKRYQAFSMAATPDQRKYPSFCKSSWGSSLLYELTGEPVYRDWTMGMGDWYVAMQDPAGYWHPWVERNDSDRIWITLEYVMHLDTLIAALASRP